MFEHCHELSGRFCFSSSSFFTPTKVTHLESELISTGVEDLLRKLKGVFRRSNPLTRVFYSRLFLVPQKEGTYSPVIDLSCWNQFVHNFHFHMEGLHCLKTLPRERVFMTSIDLKDEYFSVAIHESSQCFSISFGLQTLCFPRLTFWSKCNPSKFDQAVEACSGLSKKAMLLYYYLPVDNCSSPFISLKWP